MYSFMQYVPPRTSWQDGVIIIAMGLNIQPSEFRDWPISYWKTLIESAKKMLESRGPF
jgi:hypothetical protein